MTPEAEPGGWGPAEFLCRFSGRPNFKSRQDSDSSAGRKMKEERVDDDHLLKSNKRGKETKKSKGPIKQASLEDASSAENQAEHKLEQNLHSIEGHEPALQTKPDKNNFKGNTKCHQEYTRGCLVWHRIKGFPWWPGLVVNESDVPENLKKVDSHPKMSVVLFLNFCNRISTSCSPASFHARPKVTCL